MNTRWLSVGFWRNWLGIDARGDFGRGGYVFYGLGAYRAALPSSAPRVLEYGESDQRPFRHAAPVA